MAGLNVLSPSRNTPRGTARYAHAPQLLKNFDLIAHTVLVTCAQLLDWGVELRQRQMLRRSARGCCYRFLR